MVMEVPPSPKSVGREFVRQYYTLLNGAPAHLHRFYNNNSSFLHGGRANKEAAPAIGQREIHQKIQALNFRDCHAKIYQVDSQSTLDNGVVIQVSGELSNNGQPLRRFTQTFVLAAQSPKKYYVHNDIFRYQDVDYEDEEEDLEEHPANEVCEREPEMDNMRQEVEEEQIQNQQITTKIVNTESYVQNQQQLPSLTQQQMYYSMQQPVNVHSMMQPVTINGSVHDSSDSSIISQQPPAQPNLQQQYISDSINQEPTPQEPEHHESYIPHQQQQQPQQPAQQHQVQPEQIQQQPIKTDSIVSNEETHEHAEVQQKFAPTTSEVETDYQVPTQNANSGPKTYANLVKSYPTSAGGTSPQPPIQNLRIEDTTTTTQIATQSVTVAANMTGNQQMQRVVQHRVTRTTGPMQRDGDRRGSRYTDAHQLFLGNLPHNASENDLRQIFEKYGKVADLRVHSKTNDRMKGLQGPGNKPLVPNYGFITFEDSTVVEKVLKDLPIFFISEEGRQKLNVEEKKIRPREPGSINRPNTMDGGIRPMSQQNRGPGGPGIMRGGQYGGRGRGFSRGGGEGGRGGMRQSGGNNPNNQNYQNRR